MPTPRWRRRAGIVGLAGLLSVASLVGLPAAASWASDHCPRVGPGGEVTIPTAPASLAGCPLTGANLTGANLTGANLTGANLTGANLTGANLTGANLTGANLTGANLTGVKSGGVIGEPASLPNPWRIVNGYLIGPGADLTEADLTGQDLRSIDLEDAILTRANLTDANLMSANLTDADLTRANLTRAILEVTSLTGADLRFADLRNAQLDLAELSDADLRSANLAGADLFAADLTGADLRLADLSNANLNTSDLTDAEMSTTILTGVRGSGIVTESESESHLPRLPRPWVLRYGYLLGPGANLSGAGLNLGPDPADLSGLDLTGANLTNSYLEEAIFTGATVTLADFTGAQIFQTRFGATDGALGVTGTPEPNSGSLSVTRYWGTSETLEIPETLIGRSVTAIASAAFHNTALTQVVLPASLTSIGALAFADRRVVDGRNVTPVTGGTFTFNGPAPTIASDAFDGAENLIVRYPEGAAGWPMSPDLFGTGARQIAVPRPPTPAPTPEPTPEPASNPNPMASSNAGARPTQSTVGAPVPVPTVLRPGAGSLVIDGVSVPVTIADSGDGRTMTLSGAGVTMTLDARGPNGRPIALAPDGSLVLARGGSVPVVGSGFSPGSTVVLYLFSSPRQLVSVMADATGAISASADVPRDMPTGRHTLQIAGSTSTGQPLNLSVGLRVETPAAAMGSRPRIAVPRTRVKVGDRIPITVTGAQPRCTAQLRIKGDDSAVRLGAAGRGNGVLHAPSKPGTWVVTAQIKGPGCSPVVVRQAITASK